MKNMFEIIKNMDFTVGKYKQLCIAITKSKYRVITFTEYFTNINNPVENYIVLRHDVDGNCKNALELAMIEKQFNLKATYYFRMKKNTFNIELINNIDICNHEIGYHYETLDRCHGNIDAAVNLFQKELAIFRKHYIVKTVCMHGNPLTKHDNKRIFCKRGLASFGLIGEPYLSLDYTKFAYFSDSGRTWSTNTWRKTKDNIQEKQSIIPKNTDDLIEIVKSGKLTNICILTHPERWSKNIIDYSRRYLVDLAYLGGKTVIHKVNKVMRPK